MSDDFDYVRVILDLVAPIEEQKSVERRDEDQRRRDLERYHRQQHAVDSKPVRRAIDRVHILKRIFAGDDPRDIQKDSQTNATSMKVMRDVAVLCHLELRTRPSDALLMSLGHRRFAPSASACERWDLINRLGFRPHRDALVAFTHNRALWLSLAPR
jgi:hypothetical protein